MAGTVHVAKLHYTNLNDASHISHNQSVIFRMEEHDVLNHLNDQSFNKRAEIIEYLRIAARENGGRLPFTNQLAIFGGLAMALGDSNWDIRHQTVQLISELIPNLEGDLDICMSVVLPKLIPNIGDSKISIRRCVIQTLHVYMKSSVDVQASMHAIIQHGIESKDNRVKRETLIALPMLFTPEFEEEDLLEITRCLCAKLVEYNSQEDKLEKNILLSLQKIRNLVGDGEFNIYLQKVPQKSRQVYLKLTQETPRTASVPSHNEVGTQLGSKPPGQYNPEHYGSQGRQSLQYEFGVVPSHIMSSLNDQENFRARAQAVEELKMVMRDLYDIRPLMPHVLNFISFLNNLLDDSNFKITTVTLEILGLLVSKLQEKVHPHLRALSAALSKRMGDNKIVIRQAIMKVVMQLMQILKPQTVLDVICESLTHRNSRVRQEALNIVIASLLTFPSYEFDLAVVSSEIGPTLVDPKRQVRQAALECCALLAQAMGAGKLQPLVKVVDSVELSLDGDGVMGAVQARLARRQLPRLNQDGLVDYAMPIPISASRGNFVSLGADVDWILMASGSNSSSARTSRQDSMELESVTSSARSTPSNFQDTISGSVTPRRHLSSAGIRKLPWEEEQQTSRSQVYGNESERSPLKSRTPYSAQEYEGQNSNEKKSSRRKPTYHDQNADEGSGYLERFTKRRQQQNENAAPFSVYKASSSQQSNYANTNGSSSVASTPRGDGRTNFSSSWPDSKMFDDAGKPNRRKLEPISAPETPITSSTIGPEWPDSSGDAKKKADNSVIPTKAALARSSASSSKRKVPPIPALERLNDQDTDKNSDDEIEMLDSLRQIRNSATKKKAEKIFEGLDPQTGRGDDKIDGAANTYSKAGKNTGPKRNKKPDSPFDAKPQIVRKGSVPSTKDILSSDSVTQIETFDPLRGVTFRDNPTSDVAIVGKGYAEDSSTDPKPNYQGNKPKPRNRVTKGGNLVYPLSTASMSSGSFDIPGDEINTGVVGKGMFDNVNQEHTYGGEKRQMNKDSERSDLPKGVYGIGVQQNSLDDSDYEAEIPEEENIPISMSNSTKASMAMRVKQKKEAEKRKEEQRMQKLEQKKRDEEVKQFRREQEEERLYQERQQQERQQQKKWKKNDNDDVEALNIGSPPIATEPKTPSVRTTPNRPKSDVRSNVPRGVSANKTQEVDSPENFKPFRDPNKELTNALKNVSSDEWETKCSSLTNIRRLAYHHPESLISQLHTVNLALINEVKNLRSQVSRIAIVCLGDFYTNLKKHMDADLDQTVKILLSKSGEANNFIKDDVTKSLISMVENVSPPRAINALINGGGSSKNISVRKMTAMLLDKLVDVIGPGRILSGIRDVTDRMLQVMSTFLLDGSQEVRYYAQHSMYTLMQHEDFDRTLKKTLPEKTYRSIADKLETLKRRGVGSNPSDMGSARSRKNPPGSEPSSAPGSSKRRVKLDENGKEGAKILASKMAANDWKERHEALKGLQEMVELTPGIVEDNIIKIFDSYIPCLKDSNSKVNLCALQVLVQILPTLIDHMGSVLNMVIETVSANLSSKNKEINDSATQALDVMMDVADPVILIQPMVSQAKRSNAKIMPEILDRISYLVTTVYPKKPKQVVLHVLPLLWQLLGALTGSKSSAAMSQMREPTQRLVESLYNVMGEDLLQQANNNSNVNPKMNQELQAMIS